jgi:hypothetical protein
MKFSSNPDVCAIVSQSLKQYPWLNWECGGRHGKIRCERTRDFVPIPFSPSDFRATKNLRIQVKRLGEHGEGFIAARQRH